jgi:hypothetical protein
MSLKKSCKVYTKPKLQGPLVKFALSVEESEKSLPDRDSGIGRAFSAAAETRLFLQGWHGRPCLLACAPN